MNWKRHLVEAATLAAAAVLCAVVANALASRERKLALPGNYENATKVPPRATPAPEPPAPRPEPAATPAPAAVPTAGASAVPAAPRTPSKEAPKVAATATAAPAPPKLTALFPPHPDKPFVEISGADAALLRERGALVLDARRTNVYEEGHVAGAQSFPIWEAQVDGKIEALVGEARDTKQPIVLYCSGGDCEDSHMLAQKLFGAGFENLLVYRDGWPDWVKRGGPSRTGREP